MKNKKKTIVAYRSCARRLQIARTFFISTNARDRTKKGKLYEKIKNRKVTLVVMPMIMSNLGFFLFHIFRWWMENKQSFASKREKGTVLANAVFCQFWNIRNWWGFEPLREREGERRPRCPCHASGIRGTHTPPANNYVVRYGERGNVSLPNAYLRIACMQIGIRESNRELWTECTENIVSLAVMLPQRSKRVSFRILTATTILTFRCSDVILYPNMIPTDRPVVTTLRFSFFDFVLSSIFRVLSHFPSHNFSLPTAFLVTFYLLAYSRLTKTRSFFSHAPKKRAEKERKRNGMCISSTNSPTITFVCTLRKPCTAARRFSSSLGSIICS